MAPSSSSSSSSSPPPQQTCHFTPIQECEKEEDDNFQTVAPHRPSSAAATPPPPHHRHQPTPLHKDGGGAKKAASHAKSDSDSVDDHSVSCNKCRPSAREKCNISVVPLDHHNGVSAHGKLSSPGTAAAGIFRSIMSSITRRSPKLESSSTSSSSAAREEQWKISIAELSHKLIQTTRKRDEAVLEASRLKNSMAELERKLTKLEQYCHALKSGLDECASIGTTVSGAVNRRRESDSSSSLSSGVAVNDFLSSVAESRNSVRILARSLATQVRHVGAKVHDRIYGGGGGGGVKNSRSLLLHLEAVLSRSFYEDFETAGFHRGAGATYLNQAERREAGIASAAALRTLTWEEVLCRGTRHFSGEFSGFCDRKMSDIVAALGWNRAWPEPLLQAFFLAAKSVWIVHLLADSAEPRFEVFRVDKDVQFDPVYMEDMAGGGRRLAPATVRLMVAPGFYVCGSVVKCKVVCRYNNVADNGINNNNNNDINNHSNGEILF